MRTAMSLSWPPLLTHLLLLFGVSPSYVQNVRNNSNKRRTPKWAIRYGLVDDTDMVRKKAKSAWAGRYDERNPNSTLDAQEYEEGQVADVLAHPTDTSAAGQPTAPRLWDDNDVEYYQNGEGAVPGAFGGFADQNWTVSRTDRR